MAMITKAAALDLKKTRLKSKVYVTSFLLKSSGTNWFAET
jgi:hypothetical protein